MPAAGSQIAAGGRSSATATALTGLSPSWRIGKDRMPGGWRRVTFLSPAQCTVPGIASAAVPGLPLCPQVPAMPVHGQLSRMRLHRRDRHGTHRYAMPAGPACRAAGSPALLRCASEASQRAEGRREGSGGLGEAEVTHPAAGSSLHAVTTAASREFRCRRVSWDLGTPPAADRQSVLAGRGRLPEMTALTWPGGCPWNRFIDFYNFNCENG